MKYYIYISDAKVNMLFPQISVEEQKKIATQLKLDFKIFSISKEVEKTQANSQIHKLLVVMEHIKNHENVGTIDEPAEYFQGVCNMSWSKLHPKVVFFSCVNDGNIVGLGGSSHHVIGQSKTHELVYMPGSRLNRLYLCLLDELEGRDMYDAFAFSTSPEEAILAATKVTALHATGPKQRVEFLAKRLLCGKLGEHKILLGTPLYVALAE